MERMSPVEVVHFLYKPTVEGKNGYITPLEKLAMTTKPVEFRRAMDAMVSNGFDPLMGSDPDAVRWAYIEEVHKRPSPFDQVVRAAGLHHAQVMAELGAKPSAIEHPSKYIAFYDKVNISDDPEKPKWSKQRRPVERVLQDVVKLQSMGVELNKPFSLEGEKAPSSHEWTQKIAREADKQGPAFAQEMCVGLAGLGVDFLAKDKYGYTARDNLFVMADTPEQATGMDEALKAAENVSSRQARLERAQTAARSLCGTEKAATSSSVSGSRSRSRGSVR